MKKSLVILGMLMAAKAFGGDDVKVSIDHVSALGAHANVWFECRVKIHNGTSTPLDVTNLFVQSPGLSLKISDSNGTELGRFYSLPIHRWHWTIPANGDTTNKVTYSFGGLNGHPSLSLPDGVHSVKVQVEGTLSGSSYTNRLTSNVVEVKVP